MEQIGNGPDNPYHVSYRSKPKKSKLKRNLTVLTLTLAFISSIIGYHQGFNNAKPVKKTQDPSLIPEADDAMRIVQENLKRIRESAEELENVPAEEKEKILKLLHKT